MAYTPHTQADIKEMLDSIGAESIDALFADVPESIMLKKPVAIESLDEFALVQWFEERAAENRTVAPGRLFLGAGAYNHYTPAAVKNLINRGEFVTCYTPYQAEVSQGTLQAIFEFQSHICQLTGMDVANASLYDAGTALGEALMMAVRVTGKHTVHLSATFHPHAIAVARTMMHELGVTVKIVPAKNGITEFAALGAEESAAFAFQTPNFFGNLEDGRAARAAADRTGGLLIASCNPTALALIAPPGSYGADIALGEAQALGIPLQYGGPYAGFFAAKQAHIRQMPGRIIGRTTDSDGREGFVLTLQTREQHIRRERATSNICTNQGLFALMATMYMTFVGRQGLVEIAETCSAHAHELAERLVAETGAKLATPGAHFFHEFVVTLPIAARGFLYAMREKHDIVAGYELARSFPDRPNDVLVCATEVNTPGDIERYVAAAKAVLAGK